MDAANYAQESKISKKILLPYQWNKKINEALYFNCGPWVEVQALGWGHYGNIVKLYSKVFSTPTVLGNELNA